MRNIGAVILAGGFGTRIRDLHPDIPKPMVDVGGRPFIEWVIRYLALQKITDICLSVGYKAEAIEDYLQRRPRDGLKLKSIAEDTPQGTAGGFLMSGELLADKDLYVVANGDSLILADLDTLELSAFDAAIIGRKVDDCSRYGSLDCDDDGTLLGFEEKREGCGIINAGIYLLTPRCLEKFPSRRPLSFEYDVFPEWVSAGMRIQVMPSDAPFIDIGTPDALARSAAFMEKNRDYFNG